MKFQYFFYKQFKDVWMKNDCSPTKTGAEGHLLVSARRSLSSSLTRQLLLTTRSEGEWGSAEGRISCMGVVCCRSAGAPSCSGTRTTGVSGSGDFSSGMLSSISNDDCSWIFSSGSVGVWEWTEETMTKNSWQKMVKKKKSKQLIK